MKVAKAGDSTTSLGSLCQRWTTPFWCLATDPVGLCCNSLGLSCQRRGSSRESQRVLLSLASGDCSELLHADMAIGAWADEIFPPQSAAPCALAALPQDGAQACAPEMCKRVARIQTHVPRAVGLVQPSCAGVRPMSLCHGEGQPPPNHGPILLAGPELTFGRDVLVKVDPCLLKSWGSPLPAYF